MISVVVLVVSFTYVALGVYVRHIGQPSASRPMIIPVAAARPALPKMRRAVDILTTPNRHRPALPNDGRKIQPPTHAHALAYSPAAYHRQLAGTEQAFARASVA